MLDTIGAFGSGIGTNLLSDSLSKKLEAFKDKKAIASFTQSLRDWEVEFENRMTALSSQTAHFIHM